MKPNTKQNILLSYLILMLPSKYPFYFTIAFVFSSFKTTSFLFFIQNSATETVSNSNILSSLEGSTKLDCYLNAESVGFLFLFNASQPSPLCLAVSLNMPCILFCHSCLHASFHTALCSYTSLVSLSAPAIQPFFIESTPRDLFYEAKKNPCQLLHLKHFIKGRRNNDEALKK